MKAIFLIVAVHLILARGSDVVCEADSCGVDHSDQPDSDQTRLLQLKTAKKSTGNANADEDDEMDEDDELLDIVDEADDQKNSKKDISFRLYDLSDDSTYETFGYEKLQEIEVSHSTPTKISIHGNGGNYDIDHMFADAYFSADEDVNLIGVDWRPLKGSAKVRTKVAGGAVADMIADLIDRDQTTLDDIHVICFSFGCQVAGWASRYLRERGIGLISRLTATDPGRIGFEKRTANERISSDDAQLVDVIHSNTGKLGWQWPVGHVDFYPNGGDGLFEGASADSDNHKFAPVLFAQSIKNHEAYPAKRCEGDAHDAKTWKQYNTKSGALDPAKCQMGEEVYMGEGLAVDAQHGFYYLEASTQGYDDAIEKYMKAKKGGKRAR